VHVTAVSEQTDGQSELPQVRSEAESSELMDGLSCRGGAGAECLTIRAVAEEWISPPTLEQAAGESETLDLRRFALPLALALPTRFE
jgi:hypothetical protein